MDEHKQYFTIRTVKGSGLGDQLGTQFTRLYGLGNILGASYIYTPISFPRSIKPRWYILSQYVLFRIRFFLMFSIGTNWLSSAVNVVLSALENIFKKQQEKGVNNEFHHFLGLNNINGFNTETLHKSSFCDVVLDDFFSSKRIVTVDDFIEYIELLLKDKKETCILQFCWTDKMWGLMPQIDMLLIESGQDRDDIIQNVFSHGFWKEHKESSKDKISIVFHVRCGDSIRVNFGARSLIVYDKFLYRSEKEMTDILEIDPDRISVLPEEYLSIYKKIIPSSPPGGVDFAVISDGYELTYSHMLRNLLKRKCAIRLNSEEKRALKKKINQMNDIFNRFDFARLIIGETKIHLCESIMTLAKADIVIWGCGGFAWNTHFLFKKENKQSLIIQVKEFSNTDFQKIKDLLYL